MVEVPDELMAEWVINMALEFGEWGDVYDTASEGSHGQHEFETDWSVSDLDPEDCYVERYDSKIVVGGNIEAHYSVQTLSATYNPPSKAHPAEYENREVPLAVTIELGMDELPQPVINAEIQ